jgi:hypothetical protein
MESPGSKPAYQKQLQAIINQAHLVQTDPQIQGWPGLASLLNEFSWFAADYMGVLIQNSAPMSSRRFVLNKGIERLLHEWDILSRACEQRRGPESENDPQGFKRHLRDAEARLQSYCARWHSPIQVQGPYFQISNSPIVYFEKLYKITRSIYAPKVPVISVPLTDYDDPNNWQAMAHELGHYIYWNALETSAFEKLQDALPQAVAQKLAALGRSEQRVSLWTNWLEETFADVCATLLLGPDYALSAQELAVDQTDQVPDLAQNDQSHPCPYVRPLIALEVLREIAKQASGTLGQALNGDGAGNPGMLKRLAQRWDAFSQRGAALKLKPDDEFTLQDLGDDVRPVVSAVLYEKLWPSGYCLWDLVDWYGNHPTDFDARAQAQLAQKAAIDLPSIPEDWALVIKNLPADLQGPAKPDSSFGRVWEDWTRQVAEAHPASKQQETQVMWTLLLGLELSETKNYHRHNCEDGHAHTRGWWPFQVIECSSWQRHEHGSLGQGIFFC